ncbi:MAG: hypothetical protein A2271_04775 [Candidatus Moranbacteria bacterium RIFOXYA12_FULL_35_19]|nr:MAG: hypothetical protein UR78_C0001G0082 [Candidatus Moranbacteria bacterium GW2011_GWF2_35_39]OGI30954.1 MAG: hypothetical protein A2343_04035 [Candidatus Moranbacteria bacterium RIFOXYB12_FULL_35_8]OGI35753.1 MAG: hypothetical protein A2271_04775 [Candidatus Moranbacteria bacterium RIFOXYA12_FULL_35_19]
MPEIEKNKLLPTYAEVLRELGDQINLRKWIILKRSLLLIWPVLVGSVTLVIGNSLYNEGVLTRESPLFIGGIILLCFWAIFIVFYGAIMRHIFEIEKRIWVDSFFDKKNIEPNISWKISQKIFWPVFIFRFKIFARYYFLPVFLYLLSLFIYIVAILKFNIMWHWSIFPIILLGGPIVIWLYAYYLRIKLRFSWFIFLDQYGKDNFSFKNLIKEMEELEKISKNEQFKKAFMINFGVDSVEVLINTVNSLISNKLISLNSNVGNVAGVVLKHAGDEIAMQASSFAKIAAMYILYQFARQELYGKSQEVNDFIYNLG